MAKTIWKYKLSDEKVVLDLPAGAQVLSAAERDDRSFNSYIVHTLRNAVAASAPVTDQNHAPRRAK